MQTLRIGKYCFTLSLLSFVINDWTINIITVLALQITRPKKHFSLLTTYWALSVVVGDLNQYMTILFCFILYRLNRIVAGFFLHDSLSHGISFYILVYKKESWRKIDPIVPKRVILFYKALAQSNIFYLVKSIKILNSHDKEMTIWWLCFPFIHISGLIRVILFQKSGKAYRSFSGINFFIYLVYILQSSW